MTRSWITAAAVAAVLSAPAAAAADLAAGKAIVMQGNGHGALACVSCHGAQGAGNGPAGFPRLSSLRAGYIAKQLHDFQSGRRENAVMKPFASALSEAEIADVAAYYAAQHAAAAAAAEAPPAEGEHLALRGDWDHDIPACVSCHGPGGKGVGTSFPALAGQHASYISSQIAAWQNGTRHNDPNDLMKSVAGRLREDQVDAVAAYFASLPPAE